MNETLVAKDVVAQDYRQLVEQFGSPLLLLDKAAVRKQYRALAAALPDVRLHYALKPLPHEWAVLSFVSSCCVLLPLSPLLFASCFRISH